MIGAVRTAPLDAERGQAAPRHSRSKHRLRKVGATIVAVGVVMLTLFGLYFDITNDLWLTVPVLLLVSALVARRASVRRRRRLAREHARAKARAHDRASPEVGTLLSARGTSSEKRTTRR